jgi:hypothetical protein
MTFAACFGADLVNGYLLTTCESERTVPDMTYAPFRRRLYVLMYHISRQLYTSYPYLSLTLYIASFPVLVVNYRSRRVDIKG